MYIVIFVVVFFVKANQDVSTCFHWVKKKKIYLYITHNLYAFSSHYIILHNIFFSLIKHAD